MTGSADEAFGKRVMKARQFQAGECEDRRKIRVSTRYALVLAGWLGCGQVALAQTSPYRAGTHTLFEALDLTTPERAGSAFLGAWARGDYAVAHMILTPTAQRAWNGRFAETYRIDLFSIHEECVVNHSVMAKDSQEWEETMNDPNQIFASLVSASAFCGALPFSVKEPVSVQVGTHDDTQAVVEGATGGSPATMRLHLLHLPSGRWKIDQIDLPGADPTKKPWGFSLAK